MIIRWGNERRASKIEGLSQATARRHKTNKQCRRACRQCGATPALGLEQVEELEKGLGHESPPKLGCGDPGSALSSLCSTDSFFLHAPALSCLEAASGQWSLLHPCAGQTTASDN